MIYYGMLCYAIHRVLGQMDSIRQGSMPSSIGMAVVEWWQTNKRTRTWKRRNKNGRIDLESIGKKWLSKLVASIVIINCGGLNFLIGRQVHPLTYRSFKYTKDHYTQNEYASVQEDFISQWLSETATKKRNNTGQGNAKYPICLKPN